MKIISWNICCLPNAINLYLNPKCVIDNIITTLQYFKSDFICLQEIFDRTCIERIKDAMSSYNIIYDTKGPKSAINSGLMILSKYPLVDYDFMNSSQSVAKIDYRAKDLYMVYISI